MPLCIALAVREMGMTPAEALYAATARRRRRARTATTSGALAPGRRADLVRARRPAHVHLAYRPGVPLVAGGLGRRPAGLSRGAVTRLTLWATVQLAASDA